MNGLLLALLTCALAWMTLAALAPALAALLFLGGLLSLIGAAFVLPLLRRSRSRP